MLGAEDAAPVSGPGVPDGDHPEHGLQLLQESGPPRAPRRLPAVRQPGHRAQQQPPRAGQREESGGPVRRGVRSPVAGWSYHVCYLVLHHMECTSLSVYITKDSSRLWESSISIVKPR